MIAGEDESTKVGVGPWEGDWPTGDRYDPELLAMHATDPLGVRRSSMLDLAFLARSPML